MGNGSAAVGAALSSDGLQVPPATIAAVSTVKDTITEQIKYKFTLKFIGNVSQVTLRV